MTFTYTIRPARIDDAPAIARVHVDTWRSSYDGIVPADFLDNLGYRECEDGWMEHISNPREERTLAAETGEGEIVGFISGGTSREDLTGTDAEIYTLYVLKDFQGVGIGRQLFYEMVNDLAARGYDGLVVWVLMDNPARGFYEKLGGHLSGEKVVSIGGMALLDGAYTWPDLTAFRKL